MTSERATATQEFNPLRYSSIEDDTADAVHREILAKYMMVGLLAVATIFAWCAVAGLSLWEETHQKPIGDITPSSQPSGALQYRQAKLSESTGQGHGRPVAVARDAAIKRGSTIDGDIFNKRRTVSRRPAMSSTRSTPPLRPSRGKIRLMRVTAYCPCKKCCGDQADGVTASGKPVSFNGGKFVAAPPGIPFGTMLRIPGYNDGLPIQVIDRGGAIKGDRLDVFFRSHREALRWGAPTLRVGVMGEHPTANKEQPTSK